MENHIYWLRLNDKDSDEYYETVKVVSDKVLQEAIKISNDFINEYMEYINNNKIEYLRSFNEYFIEMVLIGVLIKEYREFGSSYNSLLSPVFFLLNKMRNKPNIKNGVDRIRGVLNYNILINKKRVTEEYSLKDLKKTINWLKATNDFNEEVIRIVNWEKYLLNKSKEYGNKLINASIELSNIIYNNGEKHLKKYLINVDEYLKVYKKNHINKEDVIYCGKGILQYYFNMICAEIMNNVYKDAFRDTEEKYIFLPTCMRRNENSCNAKKPRMGYSALIVILNAMLIS